MWNLYQQAKSYSTQPSVLFGLDPNCQYLCYCFDEAILLFGKWVEKYLDKREEKGKNKGKPLYKLETILDENFKEVQRATSLRGLLAMMGPSAGLAR